MHIYFGLGLDGRAWLPEITESEAVLGKTVVGQLGFLRLLETSVGTQGPETRDVQRMLNYLRAIQAVNTPDRFFHASLATDPLAVARHLLTVRDELKISGWSGKEDPKVGRLQDFEAVELAAKDIEGIPDRLARAIQRLEISSSVSFHSLDLVDPMDHFPKLWQNAIKVLKAKGVKISHFNSSFDQERTETDLEASRQVLARGKSAPPQGDGTLRVLIGQDPWQAARWAAAWLAGRRKELSRTVLVAPDRYKRILAAAFEERGIPFGDDNGTPSIARPSVQVLVLSLALAWVPKNPRAALAMLLLPVSPIPRAIAFRLAEALAEAPAIGSDEWNHAIEVGLKALLEKEDGEARSEKAGRRITDFFDGPSARTADGILPKEVTAICERVAKWARGVGETQDRASFREAAILADAMGAAARDCGLDRLSPEAVARLLGDVLGSGVSADFELARSGGPIVVSNPQAILASADTVVWWDFSNGATSRSTKSFWSKQQRRDLNERGIELPDPQLRSVQGSSSWPRPFSAAKKYFLAVSFDADSSREAETLHPLLDQLVPAISSERKHWLAAITVRPGISKDSTTKKFEEETRAQTIDAVTPTWQSRHDWKIGKGSLGLREVESASSLEKVLGCLFSYTLQYGAKLRSGPLEKLSDGNQLSGKIAHKVFQEIFGPGRHPEPEEARTNASLAIEKILPRYAANLLESEQRWFVAQMTGTIVDAAGVYAEFLKDNKLKILRVETEKSDVLLGPTKLIGTPDHVLGSSEKAELIMDHKWGGGKYKSADLKNGTALQLSMYAYLERSGGSFPNVGYFVIEDQEAMILGQKRMRARTVDGPAVQDVFGSSLAEIKKRLAQLEQGNITADGVHEDQANAVWKAGCRFCGFGVICGKHWGEA